MKQAEKQRHYERAETLLSEQNFPAAIIAGAVASTLAALAYGITTHIWSYSYGFAAAGVGIAIGVPMQFLGRGIDMKFGVAAAIYTVAGCILGNLVRSDLSIALATRSSPLEVLQRAGFSELVKHATSNVSFVDLVYWFVAVFGAVFLALRPLSRADRLALGMYEMRDSNRA